MQITLEAKPYATLETDALISYVFEESDPVQSHLLEIDQSTKGLLKKLAQSGELTGKTLEFTLIHAPAGLAAPRLLLVGAGKREQFSGAALRKIVGAATRSLKTKGAKKIAFLVAENDANDATAQAIAEAATTANFETDKYKTDKKVGIGVVNHCNTVVEPPEHVAALIRKALEHIPPERLVITTDCGFGREGLSRRIAYYKCVSLVEGANIVRRELGLPEARVRAADPSLYFASVDEATDAKRGAPQ